MSIHQLKTKSNKELHSICRELNLKNFTTKRKQDLINTIHLKYSFLAIQNYEDDEFDILKLYFMKLKHLNEIKDDQIEGEAETGTLQIEPISTSSILVPRPSCELMDTFLNKLEEKYCQNASAELSFENYSNERYNHLYLYHKQNILERYGNIGNGGEQILLHGTDQDKIKSILDNDLSLTVNIKHGSIFGKGIYFTNDLKLASKYSERGKKDKYYIVCIVHIGNTIKGTHNMDMLPKIDDQDRYYDTSVNNIQNPSQFVKFKNNTYNFLGILHVKINDETSPLFNHDRSIRLNPLIRTRRSRNLNCSLSLYNKTKMDIDVYCVNKEIIERKHVLLSDELKIFLQHNCYEYSMHISKNGCWSHIKRYCIQNNLQIPGLSDEFIPNSELISLLKIHPTTRINKRNIQQFLEKHYNYINKENMAYYLSQLPSVHHINRIKPLDTGNIKTRKGTRFICGFYTDKKPFPNNFIVADGFDIQYVQEDRILDNFQF